MRGRRDQWKKAPSWGEDGALGGGGWLSEERK